MSKTLKNIIRKKISLAVIILGLVLFSFLVIFLLSFSKVKLEENQKYILSLEKQIENVLKFQILSNDIEELHNILEAFNDKYKSCKIIYSKEKPKENNSFNRSIIPLNYEKTKLGYLVITYPLGFLIPYVIYSILIVLLIVFAIYLLLKYPVRIFQKELITPILRTLEIKGSDFKKDSISIDNITKDTSNSVELKLFQKKLKSLLTTKEKQAFLEGLGLMTSRISHDIKKPFSKIKIILSEFINNDLSKKDLEKTQDILNSDLEYVESLLKNMINLSVDLLIYKEDTSMNSLIESSLDIVRARHRKCDIQIDFKLDHKMMVYVDSTHVKSAIINVLDNAFDALKNKGKIWIQSKENDGFLELTLGNSGPLIPEEKLKTLFELGKSDRKHGSGLGLISVRQVMEAHKSKVWCTSSKDSGTEFHFLFELSKKKDTEPKPKDKSKFMEKMMPKTSHEKKALQKKDTLSIISVDDEDIYLKRIDSYCKKLGVSHKSFSGKEPLYESFDELNPDIAFLDLSFDGDKYCGYSVIGGLLEKFPNCYVCFHSNHSPQVEEEKALSLGAKRFIEKTMSYDLFKEICDTVNDTKAKSQDS